jgi:glutamate:Na+ symporter, ESS family
MLVAAMDSQPGPGAVAMASAMQIDLGELETLIVALVVLFAGKAIRAGLPWLRRIDLPDAVVGGLVAALLALIARLAFNVEFRFGNHLRDLLLLVFFATIGLSAKLRSLIAGGRPLFILCLVTVLLLTLQNLMGAAVALAWGAHPFYGLLAGGLSFVGGPGTALAWAKEAEAAGLEGAGTVGIGAATFALVAGALLAGPIAGILIRRRGLKPAEPAAPIVGAVLPEKPMTASDAALSSILAAMLAIAVSVFLGEKINDGARGNGLMLPGFLCALLAGILLANGADALRLRFALKPIAMGGEVALNLFLAMSLMGTPLATLLTVALPLTINVLGQLLVIVAIAYFVLFPLLGRDYDAAVATAGFLGFGIASMPVAMATMDEVTRRHGPSPKAFLLVTLAGAFFVDLANAMVAKLFLLLPMFRLG